MDQSSLEDAMIQKKPSLKSSAYISPNSSSFTPEKNFLEDLFLFQRYFSHQQFLCSCFI